MEQDWIALVQEAGVVGAGGAGFPTHVKLRAQADTVIINGAECEPLLRADQQLMATKAAALLDGLEAIRACVGAGRGVVALKKHYHDAIAALETHLPSHPKLELHMLGSYYPAGDEQLVVYEVTGRIIPEGGIPLAVGTVVVNVETALNVKAALEGKPVVDKTLTVTGAVRTPMTMTVPLGIAVGEAIGIAGGAVISDFRVVNGGPMMGAITALDKAVTKTTKGLIVLPSDHPVLQSLGKDMARMLREAGTACMQCSLCTELCPRALLGHRIHPHKLMRLAGYVRFLDPTYSPENAFLCSGCRLCEYACVMGLQPWKFNAALKAEMAKQGVRNSLNQTPQRVDPFRNGKRYPIGKLIAQLGLTDYDRPAPLDERPQAPFRRVALPLRQGVGAPAEAICRVGERVERGQLIAQPPEGVLGAKLHASIAGRVADVNADSIVITA